MPRPLRTFTRNAMIALASATLVLGATTAPAQAQAATPVGISIENLSAPLSPELRAIINISIGFPVVMSSLLSSAFSEQCSLLDTRAC
ncbi:hypothetical protein COCCU_12805 [Corynebacterium occultum]|uniref:Uncharacterized protein n=1 Tax=Corynebacterium occultum TaxID=2675219 RepID=A0A6B8W743_9CORY|nr:hypothetical protein [Corynebacterium occultum]QGU08461.1 hypothetical protein COCCU_12805 [Corynebacterium occultum]